MSRPAARVGDAHLCPSTAPAPHIGGPVLPEGCATVKIEARSAARAGDLAACMTGPDAIIEGSGTVLIGGRPAARLHEKTGHGGRIMAGAWTVRIGGPTIGPAGIEQLLKNLEEMDRLRRAVETRKKRIAFLDSYLREKTPGEQFIEDLGKLAEPRPEGVPNGTDAEADRQGKQIARDMARAEKARLELQNRQDEKRIRRLEEESKKLGGAP